MCNLPRNGSYFLDSVPHTKHFTCNANQWTKKNIHHALSVFDTFPAIFDYTETFLKFEATENREWGEYFVPVLDLRPTWDD